MRLARIPERPEVLYAYLGRPREDFGYPVVNLVRPPARFWPDPREEPTPPLFLPGRDPARLDHPLLPHELLVRPPGAEDTIAAGTRRSLNRLHAYFLVVEDPQRRLVSREVVTLAHQASLVEHVVTSPGHPRVLIADEVGLGKTVEAGLIIERLLSTRRNLRVLYLAPARLVSNVHKEFIKLGLGEFRRFAVQGNADLTDPLVIASIHRACHPSQFQRVLDAPPWDVIVVDECHHLSAWAPDGGDPKQKYKLVEGLVDRMPRDGRLMLMSGTPHQGHATRFDNLARLLRRPDEPESAVRGRVIFRTKEHVRDWNGQPLFPRREIRDPMVVDLGANYRAWLDGIRDLYTPRPSTPDGPRQRAAGWRCAQAIQWAASSVEAGLGFLVRQAIRADWALNEPGLLQAAAMLRPYRLGPAQEPVEHLLDRMRRDIEQHGDDAEDFEEVPEEQWIPDPLQLDQLLREGAALIGTPPATHKWERVLAELLEPAGSEKVVLFAQPIETVTSFVAFLTEVTGEIPALIIGGQSDDERQKQVAAFGRPTGPQLLVSSRAGSEGINLQIARRLVHLDVPWNPMDMEQRVGRVHRFGSRRTILVDTVVTQGSPEVRCYERARERLRTIASALGSREEFEALFARVMCLIPPQELQQAILDTHPSFDPAQTEIADLVSDGYRRWQDFHSRYAANQHSIRQLYRGQADWPDLKRYVCDRLRAQAVDGFVAQAFAWSGEEIEAIEQPADVVRIDGHPWLCGEHFGMPVEGPGREFASPLGLNTPDVVRQLRADAMPAEPTGAAWLRWKAEVPPPPCVPAGCVGVLLVHRMLLRSSDGGGWVEDGGELRVRIVAPNGDVVDVVRDDLGPLVRAVLAGTVRRDPGDAAMAVTCGQRAKDFMEELAKQSPEERDMRKAPVVVPVIACVVE